MRPAGRVPVGGDHFGVWTAHPSQNLANLAASISLTYLSLLLALVRALLQHLLQLARVVQRHQDVRPTHKLATDEDLGDSRPLSEALDALAQLGVR